jgi:iron(III) transport system permease protein
MVLVLPLVAVVLAAISGGGEGWRDAVATQLIPSTLTTLGLLALSAVFMLVTAVPAAWLVTQYRFPGRGFFEWALILPLAAPAYVLAYGYLDLLKVGGPVQSALRDATGWGARDYWFPDIASLPGAAFILSAALFPYVYLGARASFVTQSICTLDAARLLGAGARRRFLHVALPAARPAIMAGAALALMEVAADYGAASHLGVETLSVALIVNWEGFRDPGPAARLSLILLSLVFVLFYVERALRGRAGVQATSSRWQQIERERLPFWPAAGAVALCSGLLLLGFLVPMARLVWVAIETRIPIGDFSAATRNSVLLAGLGTLAGLVIAIIAALAMRRAGALGRVTRFAVSSGYAVPGSVLALGALAIIAAAQNAGLVGGRTVAVSLLFLVWVYASRFTAVGANGIEAALARAPASLGQAARSLGAGPVRRLTRVELRIALSGLLSGALIMFVEILKELPATLLLQPFDWETLAVRAYNYASDERLASAALPSLLITAVGLLPVIVLSRALSLSRPGRR